jgi:hypothetical protein
MFGDGLLYTEKRNVKKIFEPMAIAVVVRLIIL